MQFVTQRMVKCGFFSLSVNLMAALGSLSAIARQRPAFMSIVVQAFESLHGEYVQLSFKNLTVIATPALLNISRMFIK